MKTYTLEPTKHDDLFRVVDTDGNWKHYFLKSKNLYLRGVTTILDEGYAKGYGFNQWLLSKTKDEAAEILKVTGEKGDRIHRWIDLVLSGEAGKSKYNRLTGVYNKETDDYTQLSVEEWSAALSFATFWNRHAPILFASEEPMYNTEYGYAGTTDGIFMITKACGVASCGCKPLVGKIGLWDFKTGSGIRASYFAQVASYAKAENIHDHIPKEKEIEYVAILRLGTSHVTTGGYEMKWFSADDMSVWFRRFLAAKIIADEGYKPFNPEKDIQDIPDDIEIDLTKVSLEPVEGVVEPKPKAKKKPGKRKPRTKKPKQLTIDPNAKS